MTVLSWSASLYERTQRIRIELEDRLRAYLKQRVPSSGHGSTESPAGVLKAVRAGETDGPFPVLGRSYRRHWADERDLRNAMEEAVRSHVAWPWLRRVRGIGPTLAGRLLARLDIRKADSPSSFWAYCGLGTVPGVEYRCPKCGLSRSYPESYSIRGHHRRKGGRRRCAGSLRRRRGPDDGVRVAQPPPERSGAAAYSPEAKKICYLIGTSFLKNGGSYEGLYRAERERLSRERAGWTEGRMHYAALRKTEKIFLANLWVVWRGAADLPTGQPYPVAIQGQPGYLDPWTMVDAPCPASADRDGGD